jgi:5-methyltetrahydropteroyltriglutamate--homocysteine methyltransferase
MKVITVLSSDIGSMPATTEPRVIEAGAQRSGTLLPLLNIGVEDYSGFRDAVVSGYADKAKAGVEVPNYPQFRDMNEMFFQLMRGIEKGDGGLMAVGSIRPVKGASIPEVDVIRRESAKARELSGRDKLRLRICVTGPYTMASFFGAKTPGLYRMLGRAVARILDASLFRSRYAEVTHVCVDEPVLGFMNDPMLDFGAEGREALRAAWDDICRTASIRGVDTSMHLHNTSESLIWDVEHLNAVGSHVGDPIYTSESTRQLLEEKDKYIWAALGVTQFDTLIQMYYRAEGYKGDMPEKIGETWTGIKKGVIDPYIFLEDQGTMEKRLSKILEFFGAERVTYASPECGLNSFPDYGVAVECLRRSVAAIKNQRR